MAVFPLQLRYLVLQSQIGPCELVHVELEALDDRLCPVQRLLKDLILLGLLQVVGVQSFDHTVIVLRLHDEVGVDSLEVALLDLQLVEKLEADG